MKTYQSVNVYPDLSRTYQSIRVKESTSTLMGVEVDIFSYSIPKDQFEEVVKEVCGEHFTCDLLMQKSNGSMTFFIAPKEYCLVDGGMMYTTAASMLKKLTFSGLLVLGYRARMAD